MIIKLKKSETQNSQPTTSHLIEGEVAVNTVDKVIYVRDSNSQIIPIANYSTGGGATITLDNLSDVNAANANEGEVLTVNAQGTFEFSTLTPIIYSIALG